jgi:hypothetical protein
MQTRETAQKVVDAMRTNYNKENAYSEGRKKIEFRKED